MYKTNHLIVSKTPLRQIFLNSSSRAIRPKVMKLITTRHIVGEHKRKLKGFYQSLTKPHQWVKKNFYMDKTKKHLYLYSFFYTFTDDLPAIAILIWWILWKSCVYIVIYHSNTIIKTTTLFTKSIQSIAITLHSQEAKVL